MDGWMDGCVGAEMDGWMGVWERRCVGCGKGGGGRKGRGWAYEV